MPSTGRLPPGVILLPPGGGRQYHCGPMQSALPCGWRGVRGSLQRLRLVGGSPKFRARRALP